MMNHLMTRRRLTSVLQPCIVADMNMVDSHSKRSENTAPRSLARKALAYDAIEPELIAKLREITQRVGASVADARLRALIEVYVSQINACAYCVDLHTRDALAHGESVQRLVGLAAWRESVLFDEREVAALAWADALTLPSLLTSRDTIYEHLCSWFTQEEVVRLTMVIALANAWNRIAGGLGRQPNVIGHHP